MKNSLILKNKIFYFYTCLKLTYVNKEYKLIINLDVQLTTNWVVPFITNLAVQFIINLVF